MTKRFTLSAVRVRASGISMTTNTSITDSAYGPAILGYADSRVDDAARAGIEVGGVFALGTELEYEVAAKISAMVPAAELVRFSNSGTEAVMAALRIARAHTGKDGHIILEGGYHGLFTEVLWYTEVEDWQPQDGAPEVLPYGEGVPEVDETTFSRGAA